MRIRACKNSIACVKQQSYKRTLFTTARHGRTASYPNRPHTDPDVRNYRIRLFNNIIARVTHKPPSIPIHYDLSL